MTETIEKKSFTDKIVDFVEKISKPFTFFANLPVMQSIQEGMAATLGVTMLSSIALVIAAASDGGIGAAPLKFLVSYSGQIYRLNSLGIGAIGLYASVASALAYARRLKNIRDIDAAITALVCFFAINFDDFSSISWSRFGAGNILGGLITCLLAMKVMSWFIKKDIRIKLPDVVPNNISAVFTSIIPTSVCILVCWFIRSILGFDFITFITNLCVPLIKNVDSLTFRTVYAGVTGMMWTIGLHFMNMTSGILSPLTAHRMAENQAWIAAGGAAIDVPYYFCGGAWVGAASYGWPLVVLMLQSKVPGFKEIGKSMVPTYIFSIAEVVWFGVPVVMNPYLFISNILAWAGNVVIADVFFKNKWCSPTIVEMPWATPHLISGFVETGGDWKFLILMAVEFAYGYCVHFPFFKAYEKATLKQMEEEQQAQLEG